MSLEEAKARAPIDKAVWDVVYLASCAVTGTSPDAHRVADMDLDDVWRVSQRHLLSSTCATALGAAGILDERFVQAQGKAIRKVALMDAERAELFRRMDDAGIWHLPLKGCVLQELYPSYGMRQMADNDILIDPARAIDARDIMLSLGFHIKKIGKGAHDVYYKEPVCNFELHRMLFTPITGIRVCKYYAQVERLLVPDSDETLSMHLTDEDFYVYLVAHEHKHYSGSGTGLRSLLDVWVWMRAKGDAVDWDYIHKQLDVMGLADFEAQNRGLSCRLFSGEELMPDDAEMLCYIVGSGVYGNKKNRVSNQVAQHGRWGYFLWRAFPSYEIMAGNFRVLKRVPVLLPVIWAWRLAAAVVTKPRTVSYQLRAAFGPADKK